MKKKRILISIALMTAFSSSCSGIEFVSLKDCPHEDSKIDTRLYKSKGEVYIFDVNYDGYKDIIVCGTTTNEFYLWSKDKNIFIPKFNLKHPIFSPSEKACYHFSYHDEGYGIYYRDCYDNKGESIDTEKEKLYEVLDDNYDYNGSKKIKKKYTLKKGRNTISSDNIKDLPEKWQNLIAKMKTEYQIDRIYTKKK